MSVIVNAVLWKYHRKKDGTYPVKVRVMWKGNARYWPIHFDGHRLYLNEESFGEVMTSPKISRDLRLVREAVHSEESKARKAVAKATLNGERTFSFDRFEKEYRPDSNTRSFFTLFDSYLKVLLIEGRIGTYKSYLTAREAFASFISRDITPIDITPQLLRQFEVFLFSERTVKGRNGKEIKTKLKSKNSVAIYMRAIKVIYNLAMNENPYLNEFYPFAKRSNDRQRYQIKTGTGKKGDALKLDELHAFIDTIPEKGTPQWEAKQLWMFSFFCQGMNVRDIAHLKTSNLKSDHIIYFRRKTRNTEINERPIVIPIIDSIKSILLEVLPPSPSADEYIFKIIDSSMSPLMQDRVIMQKIKTTNKWLKRLCRDNGLVEITTYWARHTYASLLRHSGVQTEVIRELLGHSSLRTTENYLTRFDIGKTRQINQQLETLANNGKHGQELGIAAA